MKPRRTPTAPRLLSRPIDIVRKKDRTGFKCTPSLRVYEDVGEGPDFHFVNLTRFTAHIDFRHEQLVFDTRSAEWITAPFDLLAGEPSGPLRVNVDLPAGCYPYTVRLVEAGIEAEGGSRPDIEIRK